MIRRDIVVIAASLGGVRALCRVAETLDPEFPGSILAVQHTGADSPRTLANIIQRHTSIAVQYGHEGGTINHGCFYLAPPGNHLLISSTGTMLLDQGPKINHVRPAADPLFESAAAHFGARVVGVVLTGCDGDGTRGLQAIRKSHGVNIVQHPADAEAPEMPMSALNGDSPNFAVSVRELGPLLYALARGKEAHEHFN